MGNPKEFLGKMKGKGGFIFYALIAMFVINAATLTAFYFSSPTDNPLDDYTPQVVVNTISGKPGKAVTAGSPATVSGTRCNVSGSTLNVTYVYSWKLDMPDTSISIPASSGSRQFAPGCESRQSSMTMPPGVVEVSQDHFDMGAEVVKWHIQAIETPIDEEGNLGQIKTWKTNTFGVYPQ